MKSGILQYQNLTKIVHRQLQFKRIPCEHRHKAYSKLADKSFANRIQQFRKNNYINDQAIASSWYTRMFQSFKKKPIRKKRNLIQAKEKLHTIILN